MLRMPTFLREHCCNEIFVQPPGCPSNGHRSIRWDRPPSSNVSTATAPSGGKSWWSRIGRREGPSLHWKPDGFSMPSNVAKRGKFKTFDDPSMGFLVGCPTFYLMCLNMREPLEHSWTTTWKSGQKIRSWISHCTADCSSKLWYPQRWCLSLAWCCEWANRWASMDSAEWSSRYPNKKQQLVCTPED